MPLLVQCDIPACKTKLNLNKVGIFKLSDLKNIGWSKFPGQKFFCDKCTIFHSQFNKILIEGEEDAASEEIMDGNIIEFPPKPNKIDIVEDITPSDKISVYKCRFCKLVRDATPEGRQNIASHEYAKHKDLKRPRAQYRKPVTISYDEYLWRKDTFEVNRREKAAFIAKGGIPPKKKKTSFPVLKCPLCTNSLFGFTNKGFGELKAHLSKFHNGLATKYLALPMYTFKDFRSRKNKS